MLHILYNFISLQYLECTEMTPEKYQETCRRKSAVIGEIAVLQVEHKTIKALVESSQLWCERKNFDCLASTFQTSEHHAFVEGWDYQSGKVQPNSMQSQNYMKSYRKELGARDNHIRANYYQTCLNAFDSQRKHESDKQKLLRIEYTIQQKKEELTRINVELSSIKRRY